MYVGAGALLLLGVVAVCAGATYALIYSAGESPAGTEEAIGGSDEDASSFEESYPGHSLGPGASDTTPETSSPASTTARGTATATKLTMTPSSTTIEAYPVSATQQPFINSWPLLCTVRSRALSHNQYPPDGLCDFTFYAHVFLDDKTGEVMSSTAGSLEEFNAVAAAANRTSYGFSFSTDHLASLLAALSKDGAHKALFKDFIEHYGILEVRGGGTQLDDVMKTVSDVLRELYKVRMKASPRPPGGWTYLAMGLELVDHPHEVSRLPALLSSAAEAGANLLIVRTHVSTWDMRENNGTAGATMLHNPRGIQQPDMNTTLEQLQPLRFPESVLMMSFTMGVLAFTMPAGWANLADMDTEHGKPTNFSVVDYAETCSRMNDTQAVKVDPEVFIVRGDVDGRCQFIYEDETTLSEKIVYTHQYLESRSETNHFGWALFEVDREDYNDTCGVGKSFARLRAVRGTITALHGSNTSLRGSDLPVD